MIIRKGISLMLTLLMLVCCLPVSVQAEETGVIYSSEVLSPALHESPENMKYSLAVLENHIDTERFREIILSGINECAETIDVSELNISTDLAEYAADFIWYHMPEAFNVDGMRYSFYQMSWGASVLYSFSFTYRTFADTKAEYQACFAEFKAAADKMLKGIENNNVLTDTEKALLLHDRLALWNEYDYVTSSVVKHTAYGAFAKRASVCQGYAMAYMYLLQRVGIDNYYCSSETLNHGWNIVIIDNKPYHVDVTWDDRGWGNNGRGFIGRVDHDNFLRSTAGIKETGHTAYDFDSTPTDTTYDNYYWQNSSTAVQLLNNELYYIDNEAKALKRAGDGELLITDSKWYSSSGGVWTADFSCLSSAGGDLLFSLADGVYKYSFETGSRVKVYSPALGTNYSVFGFMYEDGFLICDINNTPNDAVNLTQVKSAYTQTTPVAEGIEIASVCTKTVYYIGDSLDLSGLTLKVNYSDGSYKKVSEGFTYSGFTSDKEGKVKVNVSYGGFSASFDVSVKTPSVSLSSGFISLAEGEIKTLAANTSPSGINVSWTSSDKNTAAVNSGRVTAVKKGSTVITASVIYNGKTYTDTCSVNVLCAHKNTKNEPATAATCTKTGFTEGVYCNDCKIYISGHETVNCDPSAHKWDGGKITTEGNCSVKEITTYTCQYNSKHTRTETGELDKNKHSDTKTVPAVSATAVSVGYTEGVYCNGCKTYISGHKEIPKLVSTFTDSENACVQGDYIMFTAASPLSLTAGDILKNASVGSVIKDENGKAVAEEAVACTGMTLTLPDGKIFTLVCPGDVNSDGNITAADARYVLRASVGLEIIKLGSAIYIASNINGDALAASDARLILRASVGLEDQKQWIKQ